MFFTRKRLIMPEAQISDREMNAHKEAKADAVASARQVGDKLHELLLENNFTMQIFIAAGGRHPKRSGVKS